jgi:hypothetical protein
VSNKRRHDRPEAQPPSQLTADTKLYVTTDRTLPTGFGVLSEETYTGLYSQAQRMDIYFIGERRAF